MARTELTHAKLPKLLVHAPQLFRNTSKKLGRDKLDITYALNEAIFGFNGPEALNPTDLRVLQGLAAIATNKVYQPLGLIQLLREGYSKRHGLALTGHLSKISKQRVCAVRFTLSHLAKAIGYAQPGGATRRMLLESLERLGAVTVSARHPEFTGSCRIISKFSIDASSHEISLALSPMLTEAILSKTDFLRLDIREIQKIRSDATRLIHMRLHWINQGSSGRISLEKLCSYVYADCPASATSTKHRRREVRNALQELTVLGWSITIPKDSQTYLITRPASRKRNYMPSLKPKSLAKNVSEYAPTHASE